MTGNLKGLSRVFSAPNSCVSSEDPLASDLASRVMRNGGNAFDAAVVAAFSLAVVLPQLSGPGGDFFALFYHSREDRVYCLNSSGWAPAGMSSTLLKSLGYRHVPSHGALSTTIPGFVAGVRGLHERFGAMQFKKLLEQPITLAKGGFAVSSPLVNSIRREWYRLSQGARSAFKTGSHTIKIGEPLLQPRLARVLRSIADEKEAFYKGRIAKKIVQEVRQAGVPIELEDMALFEPEWCEPLRCSYNGASIFEVAPNSMGATTLLILKLLEKERLDGVPPDSLARMQKTLGAVKTAYARRDRRLADPRFVPFSLKDFLRVGSSTGSRRGTPAFPSSADTTFFAIADKEGNLLSCVQSLFSHFGSKSFLHELGFFLNNRASGFEMEGPNGVESRKRPLNTLSALIIARSGKPEIALGCSGGNFRPQQHALFVTNLFDYSMDLERSISFPRFLLSDSEVMVERGYSGVRSLGGKIRILPYPGPTGVAHGIDCAKNRKLGVADFRGGGAPHGD